MFNKLKIGGEENNKNTIEDNTQMIDSSKN